MTLRAVSLACVIIAAACAGCRHSERVADRAPTRADELRSLPYAATAGPADDARRGVTRIDELAPADATVLLYSSRRPPVAELIDRTGRTLRRWSDPRARYLVRAQPLGDGSLAWLGAEILDDGPQDEDRGRYLLMFRPDGTPSWRARQPFHHDIVELPDGSLLTLAFRHVELPELGGDAPVRDDLVVRVDRAGRVLESRSLLEIVRAAPGRFRLQPVGARTRRGRRTVDLFHANTVRWIDAPASRASRGLFASGSVMVTSRHQNAVLVFSWEDSELVWSWGPGELDGPHDAQLLDSGRVLVFDNGLERGWSRVLEIEPSTGTIAWEYRGDPPESFFTRSRGTCQRLPGGNTLITESARGRAFEVSPDGRVVWEFFNPHNDASSGERGTIGRMLAIPRALADRIIERRSDADPTR
ncbi:MAG: hypothetical protein D6738_14880 [Acidobacteria bacterium]|nr:MAG: hypothetical protein D6738_14880 [Acidobacteriota bacterium]